MAFDLLEDFVEIMALSVAVFDFGGEFFSFDFFLPNGDFVALIFL